MIAQPQLGFLSGCILWAGRPEERRPTMTQPLQLSTSLRTWTAEAGHDWAQLADFARAADEAGIDRLVTSDHVVFGENLEAYGDPANGGARCGRQPTGPDGLWLDPLHHRPPDGGDDTGAIRDQH